MLVAHAATNSTDTGTLKLKSPGHIGRAKRTQKTSGLLRKPRANHPCPKVHLKVQQVSTMTESRNMHAQRERERERGRERGIERERGRGGRKK